MPHLVRQRLRLSCHDDASKLTRLQWPGLIGCGRGGPVARSSAFHAASIPSLESSRDGVPDPRLPRTPMPRALRSQLPQSRQLIRGQRCSRQRQMRRSQPSRNTPMILHVPQRLRVRCQFVASIIPRPPKWGQPCQVSREGGWITDTDDTGLLPRVCRLQIFKAGFDVLYGAAFAE